MATLIGRAAERIDAERLADDLRRGPATRGWVGPPGVGKTALLRSVIELAEQRGIRVASLWPTDAEARIAHAGLRDLVAQLDPGRDLADRDGGLPAPQRLALAVALAEASPDGRADAATGALALRAAVATILDRAAQERPVLIVVDDLHWLDRSTADLLAYAARRTRRRLGFAFARRSHDLAPDGPADLGDPTTVVALGPLDDAAVRDLVRRRSPRQLDRSEVEQLVALAGGNAFVAVQLAETGDLGDRLPSSLDALASRRLATVAADALPILHAASADASPTVERLVASGATLDEVTAALAAAEEVGVIRLDGSRVAFAHPLLRHASYASLSGPARRAVHRRLAQVATEPEEQARHLALASIGPDPEVLAALDAAASTAARRGAPADAAELLEHACALDPGGATTPGRQVGAAEHRLASGDLRRAAEVLDEVLAHAATGRTVPAALARAHAARATLSQLEGDLGTAAEGFRRAIECSEDPDQRTSALLSLVFLLTNTGALGEARHLLEADADRARPAPALAAAQDATTVMVGYLTGEPIDWGRLDAAVAVELQAGAASVPTTSRPLLVASLLLHMAGRLEEAVGCCERLQDALAAEGDEAALALVDFWVSWIWGGLGRLDELEAKVDAAAERARAFGAPGRVAAATTASATLAAWRGDAARCVADAQTAIAALGPGSPPSVWAIAARGLLELGRGDHEAALEQYQPLLFVAEVMGLHQGTAAWWTPELIEVLTALGRAEEARALLGRYDVRAFGDRAGDARAVALRCAGLVAEAEGDLDGAERSLEAAIAEHAAGGSPLARARSELHLGALLRRRGQRRAARSHLEAAHSTFDAVGARGWADRARTELDRLGLRPSHDGSLTPAERSVARLVAEGLSNKAIATRLHTSAKTVEAHLTRAYRKVGVRRRAELAVLVARDPERFAERPD